MASNIMPWDEGIYFTMLFLLNVSDNKKADLIIIKPALVYLNLVFILQSFRHIRRCGWHWGL